MMLIYNNKKYASPTARLLSWQTPHMLNTTLCEYVAQGW
jgi:hypothetical protein